MVEIKEILNIYEKEIRRTMKNKQAVLDFEKKQNDSCPKGSKIIQEMPNKWDIHLIHEPKERIIMSLDIDNKLANHCITRFVLIPNLEKRLDKRNVATRKNYGTSEGRRLIKKYFKKMK